MSRRLNNPLRCLPVFAVVVVFGLAVSCCVSQPKAPHVLEFAIVADGSAGALHVDYTPRGGTPVRVNLEQPKQFAVARADMMQDPSTGDPAISVDFEHEAGVQFEDWTAKNLERQLAVVLDGQVMLLATIQSPVSGQMMFLRASKPFTTAEVRDVVDSLNADH